jgi:hypothetical protein
MSQFGIVHARSLAPLVKARGFGDDDLQNKMKPPHCSDKWDREKGMASEAMPFLENRDQR